jgi:hypothetical protein
MVELDLKTISHSNSKLDFTEINNKYYSGMYLISSIKHSLTKSEYMMDIELIKDSYPSEI